MRDDLIGTVVEERYLIEAMLGAGAMGRVYRARHTRINREVAIKVLRNDLVREPAIVERFEREARVAAKLRHPNLVGVLDVGEHLMVMELAAGVSLAELVGAPMPRARLVALVSQLLRGLEHAHAAGLVHRDLKPENILVERHGDGTDTARIVDFGIAVLRDRDATSPEGRRLTDAGLVVGTPLYMSPEQATGRAFDHRTDLFSLGVIVYELLAGVPPFEGTGAEVAFANVTKDPPLIAARVRGVDVDPLLEAFARKLMARRADDRFASAHDALLALELIDRDRDAAARQLGMFGGVPEAPPAVLRLPLDSDRLTTLPLAEGSTRHVMPLRFTDPDATDEIRRTARGTRWMLGGAAVAVLALVAIWALMRGETAPATARVQAPVLAPAPTVIELPEPPAPPAHIASAEPVAITEPVATPVAHAEPAAMPVAHAASVAMPIATVPAAHRATPHAVPTPAIASHIEQAAAVEPAAVAAQTPVVEQRGVPTVTADESAAAVAARYRAVGSALVAHGNDDLWQQYRRIQLGDAMATAANRHAALAALEAIARALPAS